MSFVVDAENVGKKYLIRHRQGERYLALRDSLASTLRGVGRRLLPNRSVVSGGGQSKEEFWALKNVGFEIKQGERVGIIGRNGAGKSTLLKILSRITEPSTGRIRIKGRVASLLEVGTGFHPELTGRENIFLNGAILGMTKSEIELKFDDIVEFAEVERFLDTPVKRYSSGMYVRLAFAVAAHLEPEILVVDEVLAVGDAAFQKKCLGRMGEVSREGRTVLFVSHNMSAVRQLCERGIVIEGGEIAFDGSIGDAIARYQAGMAEASHKDGSNPIVFHEPGSKLPIRMRSIGIGDTSGHPNTLLEYKDPILISVEVEILESSRDYYAAILIFDDLGQNVIFTSDEDVAESAISKEGPGHYIYNVSLPAKTLKPGRYSVTAVLSRRPHGKLDRRDGVMQFEVCDTTTRRGIRNLYRSTSVIAPEVPWSLNSKDE